MRRLFCAFSAIFGLLLGATLSWAIFDLALGHPEIAGSKLSVGIALLGAVLGWEAADKSWTLGGKVVGLVLKP
jgi:hypothetical protein